MVTSTSSGLSVPDWPTTYGHNMFTYPLERMVGPIFYEHGHRLIASTVGFITIGLVVFVWRVDPRRWMRKLSLAALGIVILQGVLGGLTVLYMLPAPISIGHASLAQVFFCLTVSIALFTSRGWIAPAQPPVQDPGLRRYSVLLVAAIYAQILLGATMRHLGAGLAIPDFPTVFGGWLPRAWPLPVAIHFAHRMGALAIVLLVAGLVYYVSKHHGRRRELTRPVLVLILAVAVQVTLGAFVVLSLRQPIINTLHVATGAIVLGTSVVLALRAFHGRIRTAPIAGADADAR